MADPENMFINTSVKQKDPEEALVIAVTTRAIFNLEKEHEIFLMKGMDEYMKHQKANENNPLEPGTAFAFIQAVHFANKKLLERNSEEKKLFDVIVLSNNSPEGGVRIINSAKKYEYLSWKGHFRPPTNPLLNAGILIEANLTGLEISKFCFVSDEDSTQYLKTHNVKLFLSADRTDVCNALKRGVSAALIIQQEIQAPTTQLRVVFDGDAVLFSDETDRVFRENGLEGAIAYEKSMESVPMGEGPLKAFALHLGKMRKKFDPETSPIRTYLVTARSGRDMGIRAIKTLREWGLAIDEAFFMNGAPKGPILSKIQPHIFFDDSLHNIQGALDVGIPSALVPCDCSTEVKTYHTM